MQKLFMVIHGQQLKNNIEVRKGCYTKLLKYKDEIINKHIQGKNTVELSKEYNTCEQTIANFLYKDVPKVYLQRKLDKCIEFFKTRDIKISY